MPLAYSIINTKQTSFVADSLSPVATVSIFAITLIYSDRHHGSPPMLEFGVFSSILSVFTCCPLVWASINLFPLLGSSTRSWSLLLSASVRIHFICLCISSGKPLAFTLTLHNDRNRGKSPDIVATKGKCSLQETSGRSEVT